MFFAHLWSNLYVSDDDERGFIQSQRRHEGNVTLRHNGRSISLSQFFKNDLVTVGYFLVAALLVFAVVQMMFLYCWKTVANPWGDKTIQAPVIHQPHLPSYLVGIIQRWLNPKRP